MWRCWLHVSVQPFCWVCVLCPPLPSNALCISFPPPVLNAEGHFVFPSSSNRCLHWCLSSPPVCVCVCVRCLCEGVCDSRPVKSDVWDAKGGVVPYLPAPSAPAVWSCRPRLLLPPLSSWLLSLSLCGGLCCRPSFFPSFPPLPSQISVPPVCHMSHNMVALRTTSKSLIFLRFEFKLRWQSFDKLWLEIFTHNSLSLLPHPAAPSQWKFLPLLLVPDRNTR